MKKIFPGYYRPTEEEFSNLWEFCLFVLDANVLLNLYRYSQYTSNELIKILKKISNRLWIPHQAALEYQENRLKTIVTQFKVYDELEKLVEESKQKLKNKLDSLSNRHPYIDPKELLNVMQKACEDIKEILKNLKEKHPDLIKYDTLRDVIDDLLKNKIGKSYSQKKLSVIYDMGERRYEQKIPPGYMDNYKEGAKRYGDIVLWFQIIDKARRTKKPIILITDDRKEDWWRRFENKTIGPRPELVHEILSKTGVSFYLYQADPFMDNAQKFLNQKVDKKAIDEVRGIRERDEENARITIEKDFSVNKLTYAAKAIDLATTSLSTISGLLIKPDTKIHVSPGTSLLGYDSQQLLGIKNDALKTIPNLGIKSSELYSNIVKDFTENLNLSANSILEEKKDNLDQQKEE